MGIVVHSPNRQLSLICQFCSVVRPFFFLFPSVHSAKGPQVDLAILAQSMGSWVSGDRFVRLTFKHSVDLHACMHRTQKQPPHTAARYIPTWSVGLLGAAKRKRELFLALVETGRHSTSKGGVAWPPVSFVSMCIMAVRILASS